MPHLRAYDFNLISHMRHRVVSLTCATGVDLRDSKLLRYGGIEFSVALLQVS